VKTRAPLDEAPCAMLNCECSLSATMYSGIEFSIGHHLRRAPSSSPCKAGSKIGRNHIHVGILGACAAATQAVFRTVFFFFTFNNVVAMVYSTRSPNGDAQLWVLRHHIDS